MATFLPSQHQRQADRFTADGITDVFYLTYKPIYVRSVTIDGVQQKTGYVGKQFFFLGYDALIDEHASTLSFALPPPNTNKQNNIEVVYTYVPATPTPSNSTSPGKARLGGQQLYTMYPTGLVPTAPIKGPTEETKRCAVAGWNESDYLDYADFEKAVNADQPISYALCQWLLRQSYGNIADAFTESEWNDWYDYALDHCSRFAKEQPKRRH